MLASRCGSAPRQPTSEDSEVDPDSTVYFTSQGLQVVIGWSAPAALVDWTADNYRQSLHRTGWHTKRSLAATGRLATEDPWNRLLAPPPAMAGFEASLVGSSAKGVSRHRYAALEMQADRGGIAWKQPGG